MSGTTRGFGLKAHGQRAGVGGGWRGRILPWVRLDYLVLLIASMVAVLLTWKFSDRIYKFGQSTSTAEEGGDFPPLLVDGGAGDGRVPSTILTDAVKDGAVCLDGSPPAYYMEAGVGDGAKNWLVYLEGGGWCYSDEDCLQRSQTQLGSSKYMAATKQLGGLTSSSPSLSPDFYSWNRIYVKYCDGGSFNADVADPMKMGSGKIYYRGQRIWAAVMKDLLAKGMSKAEKAFLAGCSAGGLASVLHCDQFSDLLPKASVKCLTDAGLFIHVPDVSGKQTIEELYAQVVKVHGMSRTLPMACTSKRDKKLCLFQEYFIDEIKTPIFYLNSAYDSWQFENVLLPRSSDLQGTWDRCRSDLNLCTDEQMKIVQKFRDDVLERLRPVLESEQHGSFIDSCYLHCQAENSVTFVGVGPKIDGKSIAGVVGDWYFGRNSSHVVDCPFPCNPTCSISWE